MEIREEWRDDEDRANEDSQKGEPFLAKSEAVDSGENDNERLEPDVQDALRKVQDQQCLGIQYRSSTGRNIRRSAQCTG